MEIINKNKIHQIGVSTIDNSSQKINLIQCVVIILNCTLGAGILTLPRSIGNVVGTPDIWISIIIGGLIVTGMGILIVALCQRFPGENVFQFSHVIIGKWLSYITGLAMITYFILLSSYEIRVMSEVTQMYLLEGTPSWAITSVFMWIGIYLISGGLAAIIRVL